MFTQNSNFIKIIYIFNGIIISDLYVTKIETFDCIYLFAQQADPVEPKMREKKEQKMVSIILE
jgi:hypothetical protein